MEFAAGATALPPAAAILSSAREELAARLAEVEALDEDWDGYGARPVRPGALVSALRLVEHLAQIGVSLPAIVPVPHGGIQLHWQAGPIEMELEFAADGHAAFSCDDRQSGEELDGDLPADGDLLGLALARLSAHAT